MLSRISDWFIYIGLPVVAFYQNVRENVFLNVAAEDASGFEKAGDVFLTPLRYLMDGKVAVPSESEDPFAYEIRDNFDYRDEWMTVKLCGSALIVSPATIAGCLLKGFGLLSKNAQKRHDLVWNAIHEPIVVSNNDYYRSIGIDFQGFENLDEFVSQSHKRRPGAENHLEVHKEALKAIAAILVKHEIPFWVDCGTLLGTLRYGGVIPWDCDIDIAILEPDFENVKRALKELDPKKYHAEDWSGRAIPKSYIRVYIADAHDHLDIYHFRLEPEKESMYSILSNEESRFMFEWWKIRERRFCSDTAFSLVFPLKKADFDGITVYVPNKTVEYLQDRYGKNINPNKIYNDLTGEYEKDLSHPYWKRAFVK